MSEPVRRHRAWPRVVAVVVAAAMLTAVAVGVSRTRLDTTASSFLPAGDPAHRAWTDVQQSFGADPIVVVLESAREDGLIGAHLPTVLALEGRLAQLEDVSVVYGPATTLNQLAIRAQQLLAEISGRRDALREGARQEAFETGATEEEASAAADRATEAFDTRYGNLLLGGMSAGLPTLHNPQFTRGVVYDDAGRVRPDLQWLLPDQTHGAILVRPREILGQDELADLTTRISSMVDQTASDVDGLTATVTGAPVVTTALAEQIRRELPRLALVAVALVALAFALTHRVPWSRRFLPLGISLVSTAVTVAAFGWLDIPLSIGVLGFLPVLLGVGSDFPIYAARRGGSRAILTAAVASAVGFGALALSPLPFVRSLGLALAIGVLVSAILGLVVAGGPAVAGPEDAAADTGAAPSGRAVPGRPLAAGIAVVGVGLAAFGWWGLTSLDLEARPEELASGLPAVDRAQEAEDVLGASGEIAVVVEGHDVISAESISWFRQADAAVARAMGDRLRPLLSPGQLLGFLGEDPSAEQVRAGTEVLPSYLTSAVIRPDNRQALLLYGLELTDLRVQAELVEDLRRTIPTPPEELQVDVVGLPVVAARSVSLLDQARVPANLAGLAGAAAVLFVGIRRRWWAGLALVASATAFGWLLAGMWVLGLSLSPLTIALGSLTAAVGGEFTVVALEHRGRASTGFGSVDAAAITSAAGFLALTVSDLVVLRTFGLTLASSVILAWASSRLTVWLLPAFAGPRRTVPRAPRGSAMTPTSTPVGSRLS